MKRIYYVLTIMMLMGIGGARAAQVPVSGNGADNEQKISALQKEITKIMLVQPDTTANTNAQAFEDNVNAVQDNQNKMMLNTASRAVAMGERAIALATLSGEEDLKQMKERIEKSEDMMTLLDGIATLQAQHLQKINAITSLRSKLLELNALNGIMSGDVFTATKDKEEGETP